MADSLIIMVLALVVFGPRKLPQIGRQIGKLMYEFRKASNDFKFQMEEELRMSEEADRRKREETERQQRLALAAQTAPTELATETPASEPAASTTATEPAVEAPYPRIQPPSTGEPVAAARPGSGSGSGSGEPAEPSAAPESHPAETHPAENGTAPDENSAVTEQATHNG
jgi:sec-independent protein translocase protein TatB